MFVCCGIIWTILQLSIIFQHKSKDVDASAIFFLELFTMRLSRFKTESLIRKRMIYFKLHNNYKALFSSRL